MEEATKKPQAMEAKTVAAETPAQATTSMGSTSTTTTTKKGSNTLIIVIIVLFVLLALCCGIPFVALRMFGVALNSDTFRNGIQNSIEKSIEDEAKKQGTDIDLNLGSDTGSTKPLPSSIPSKVRALIPSSWGNPYSTVTSSEETKGSFYAVYSLKNKTLDSAEAEVESNLTRGGWKYTKATLSTGSISFVVSDDSESDTSFTITVSETDKELAAIFGGTYAK